MAGPPDDALLPIHIGYDPRQPMAYNVLQQSILRRSTRPVAITPLVLETLPIERYGLTPFTFTRFLVPWLNGFDGWALFLDLDMLVRADIAELFALADPDKAAMVTKLSMKLEWASMILFNCGHPANAVLTPDYVDDPDRCVSPHELDWLDPALVGALPAEWNHTVGYDAPRPDAKLVHFTQGVPLLPETRECEHAASWMQEAQTATSSRSWADLMGRSIHAARTKDGRVVPKLHPDAIA